jgi:hypothetical protein
VKRCLESQTFVSAPHVLEEISVSREIPGLPLPYIRVGMVAQVAQFSGHSPTRSGFRFLAFYSTFTEGNLSVPLCNIPSSGYPSTAAVNISQQHLRSEATYAWFLTRSWRNILRSTCEPTDSKCRSISQHAGIMKHCLPTGGPSKRSETTMMYSRQ